MDTVEICAASVEYPTNDCFFAFLPTCKFYLSSQIYEKESQN